MTQGCQDDLQVASTPAMLAIDSATVANCTLVQNNPAKRAVHADNRETTHEDLADKS
jgi:hypothetical protein